MTALDVASKTIAADDSYKRVLVVGAYGMTRYINWKDKKTCTLFADGAGAVVLGASDKPGFMGAKLLAAGEYHDALGVYTGGTYRPATAETLALTNGKPAVQFVRKFPATFNTERWPMLLKQLLERAKLTMNDVDQFVFTQLNLRTIEATMKVLEQPMSKAHWTMDKWGYTGSACIPMTLDDAVVQGQHRRRATWWRCAPAAAASRWPRRSTAGRPERHRHTEEGTSMFIGDWMGRGATYWPEHTAVVDVAKGEAGRFTYRAMNARAEALAGWLRDVAGVARGDRVGLVAHNGVEYLDVLFACGKLGAIFVPYNWRLHAQELTELVRDTGPRVLLFSEDFREGVATVRQQRGRAGCSSSTWRGRGCPRARPYAQTLAHVSASKVTNEQVNEEDILCLLFTGGTTGKSKGARISYRMVAWNTLNTLIHEVRPGDVTVTHTPMFHTGGLLVYTVPLLTCGGTVVLMRRWDAEEMLRLVEREKVTLFFAVPTQYQQMYDSPRFRSADLSSVRFVTSGGAPLPVPLLQAWQAVHTVPFKQGFGMTEFGPGLFSMGPEFAVSKAGSIGRPNYFIDARLVDDEGRDVPEGATGELILKGPSMCSGYFENAEATAEAIDADGWFHTGDLAHRDADGFYFINGRKKDMFISGGENVYPLELETVLYEHPAVQAVLRWWACPTRNGARWAGPSWCSSPAPRPRPRRCWSTCAAGWPATRCPSRWSWWSPCRCPPAGKILKRELRERAIAADAKPSRVIPLCPAGKSQTCRVNEAGTRRERGTVT